MFARLSGLLRASVGKTSEKKFVVGFKKVWDSKEFKRAAKMLDDGVSTFEEFDELWGAMNALEKANPGLLGFWTQKLYSD